MASFQRQIKTINVIEHWIIGKNIVELNEIPQYSIPDNKRVFEQYAAGRTVVVNVSELEKISTLIYRRVITYAQNKWDTSQIPLTAGL